MPGQYDRALDGVPNFGKTIACAMRRQPPKQTVQLHNIIT